MRRACTPHLPTQLPLLRFGDQSCCASRPFCGRFTTPVLHITLWSRRTCALVEEWGSHKEAVFEVKEGNRNRCASPATRVGARSLLGFFGLGCRAWPPRTRDLATASHAAAFFLATASSQVHRRLVVLLAKEAARA